MVKQTSGSRDGTMVEFVVGSCPCSEGFSLGTPVSSPPHLVGTIKIDHNVDVRHFH